MDEPIAVIGLGCRFPGDIHGPEALWEFLSEGRSAVGEVPPDRWASFDDGSPEGAAALAGTTRWGSFLSEVDAFDAEFFEISPREAARMDPQQRLLLEVAHEALEHAGIPAGFAAADADGGVRRRVPGRIRISGDDGSEPGRRVVRHRRRAEHHRESGVVLLRSAGAVGDGRHGVFVVVGGGASGVSEPADGGFESGARAGVNLLLSPAVTRSFDQAEAMSRTGRCHAFDAGADGFVRGEGCGVVVLKRLSDALRDGDRVLAVVRGSAVNQDGRSNGLMAPNPAAQMAVLRAAYANAGVPPREVDYVEAHGTGTLLGDPIEARALGTVLGRGRAGDCAAADRFGQVESGPFGGGGRDRGFHQGGAGGAARAYSGQPGFHDPNPHIPFENLRLESCCRAH